MIRRRYVIERLVLSFRAVAALIAVVVVCRSVVGRHDKDYLEQLKLVRAEGLPANAAEFAASIPAARASENAAPLYRSLVTRKIDGPALTRASQEVVFHPSAKNLETANRLLASYSDCLKTADEAVLLPRCWFNRDWSKSEPALSSDLTVMRDLAKLVGLRASIACSYGNPDSALDDARKMFVIARHAGEEPEFISHLIHDTIYLDAARNLAYWAFMHREQSGYRMALEKAAQSFPPPNLRDEHRDDLFMMLAIVEQSMTPEGRRQLVYMEGRLGLRPSSESALENPSEARVHVVEAERLKWEALGAPTADRARLLRNAGSVLRKALTAFPAVAALLDSADDPDDIFILARQPKWLAERQQLVAVVHALAGDVTPRFIRTDDLLSPGDGTPLSYRFDGRQIVIAVSGVGFGGRVSALKIPPDHELSLRPGRA